MHVHGAALVVRRVDGGDLGPEGALVEACGLYGAVDGEVGDDAALHGGHGGGFEGLGHGMLLLFAP